MTKYIQPEDIETLFVEIVIGKIKWLFLCSYSPLKSIITYHLQEIVKGLDFYTSSYEKIYLRNVRNFNKLILQFMQSQMSSLKTESI